MPPRSRPAARLGTPLLCLTLLGGGCGGGGGTEPITPAAVALNSSAVAFTSLGQTRQLAATVTDQNGETIASPSLTWTSSAPTVAGVSATGLVTAAGAGSAQITAAAGSASAAVTVTVTQTPTQIQRVSGDNQTAALGQAVALPLTAVVRDAGGAPVAGASVTFGVAAGAGTLGTPSAVTGADGRAVTGFTPLVSGAIQVTAAVQGTTLTTVFTVTGTSPFAIELRFLTTLTAAQTQAFTAARQRWQALIVGDLADAGLDAAAGDCGSNSPAIQQVVDDVLILVTLESIDGPGSVLGEAGPCFIRDGAGLTAMGLMRFDTDDLALIEAAGLLEQVILHEMAHVLGFGTLWSLNGLVADPSLGGGTDPHFTGAQATAEFDAAGGAAYVGLKVPVEDTGGPGTADAHWRETVFGRELMTGFVQAGLNPLSRISVASMSDLGYAVSFGAADPYTVGAGLRAASPGPVLELRDDVLRQPIRVVNPAGQVVRILER